MGWERKDAIGLDMRQKRYRYIRPAIATRLIKPSDERADEEGRAGNLERIFSFQVHQGYRPVTYRVTSGRIPVQTGDIQSGQPVGLNSSKRLRAMKIAARAGKADVRTLIRYGTSAANSYTGGSREGIIRINFYNRGNSRVSPPSVMNLIGYIAREEAALMHAPDSVSAEYPVFGADGLYTPQEAIAEMGSDEFFTMIISPADKNVDLEALTVNFLEQSVFPACSSRPRKYFACCHYNTAHPHVHVIISRVPEDVMADGLITLNGTYIRRHMRKDLAGLLTAYMGPRTAEEKGEINALRTKSAEIGKEDYQMLLKATQTEEGPVFRLSDARDADTPRMRSKLKALTRAGLCRNIVTHDEKNGTRDFAYLISREHACRIVRKLTSGLFRSEDITEDLIVDNHESVDDYEGMIVGMKASRGRSFFLIRDNDGHMHVWYGREDGSAEESAPAGNEIIRTPQGMRFIRKGRTRV